MHRVQRYRETRVVDAAEGRHRNHHSNTCRRWADRMKPLLSALATSLVSICTPNIAHADQPIILDWPLACDLGRTCFIQNYVDHDPSDSTLDFRCGHQTYDGHDGTDIRLPDIELQKKGVVVLAAAPGQVTHTRHGMEDVFVKIAGKAAIADRECGNGVVIEHVSGWSTQYCHMAKGSIRVKPGDSVNSEQAIGLVGLSGNTEFPHLHLTVRHNGSIVDPFSGVVPAAGCNAGQPLWSSRVMSMSGLRYETEVMNAGFADRPVAMDMIETGEVKLYSPDSHSSAIIAYVRAIGLHAEDEQVIELKSPDDVVMVDYRAPKLAKGQAQYFVSAGKKLTSSAWLPGTYKATFVLRRSGVEVERKNFQVDVAE